MSEFHDGVDLPRQPAHAFDSARENLKRCRPLSQFVAHQQPPGRQTFSFLEQRQRLQQVIGRRRAVAFGNPLEKHQRPFGSLIQKGCGGGECQDARIAGTSANRRFGQFQEPGVTLRIVEISREPLNPKACIARRFERKQRELWRSTHE